MGELNLRIPKLREGSYFPSLLEPRRRAEKALLAVVQQAYVEGVSTRKLDELVQALGLSGTNLINVTWAQSTRRLATTRGRCAIAAIGSLGVSAHGVLLDEVSPLSLAREVS